MAQARGFLLVTDAWGDEAKQDTVKCNHCQATIFLSAGQRPEHFCRSCMEPICPLCANGSCDHFEKKLDRAEATDRWLRDRFEEKFRAAEPRTELARIEVALARQRFLTDLGF